CTRGKQSLTFHGAHRRRFCLVARIIFAYCSGGRSASKIGSSTSLTAVMHTRSRRVEMPSGRSLPLLNRLSTSRGFPCCVRFPGVHAVATTPAQRLSASSARFLSRISLPDKGDSVGPRIGIFEDCSAFIHITACTLVGSPKVIRYIEGFSHFVTSMTAPTTSGWSILPGGICTHWKAPPFHGAHHKLPAVGGRFAESYLD